MILQFQEIGKNILGDINYTDLSFSDKFKILKSLSPNIKTEVKKKGEKIDVFPISINFNLNDEKIELNSEKSKIGEEVLLLEKKAPNGLKPSFYSNNYNYFLESNDKGLFALSDFKKIISNEKLTKLINVVIEKFYIHSDNKYIINYSKIDKEINDKKEFDMYIKNLEYPNLFFIKINGKHILETEFRNDYINAIFNFYYPKQEEPIKNVDLIMKFYNQDKKEFSFNNNGKYFQSNPLSNKEIYEINAGMKYILNNKSIFCGLDYFILPNIFDKEFVGIFLDQIKNEFNNHSFKKRLETSENYKIDNLTFSLIFFNKEQSAFYVLMEINDLSYFEIKKINFKFSEINNNFSTNIAINQINEIFFKTPNQKIEEIKKYQKSLMQFIKSIYKHELIEKYFLIENSLNVTKKRFYFNLKENKNKQDLPEILKKSFYYMLFLIKNNNLEGFQMNNDSMYLNNKDLNEFFTKSEITDKNIKGLIIFGYLINQVIYAQKKKSNETHGKETSSTFIKKVGFDGLDKNDLIELFIELKEYEEIYKLSNYHSDERVFVASIINNINESKLSNQEINYYILLGVDIGKIIGINYAKHKGETQND